MGFHSADPHESNFEAVTMGPFNDVKVLDLTSMVSGPVAAMMLADQGADVVKV